MVENAKITDAFLGIEDHGILTIIFTLRGDGWGQCYGGYSLSGKDGFSSMGVIKSILDAFKVKSWNELEGKFCRVLRERQFGKILGIGDIIEDRWFSFERHFAENK